MGLIDQDAIADKLHDLARECHDVRSYSKSSAYTKAEYLVRNAQSIPAEFQSLNICEPFGAVINCAVRYCLGRQTYMPSIIISYVTSMMKLLDDHTLHIIMRDIDEAEKIPGGLGSDSIDKPDWIKLRNDIKFELERRGQDGNT